MLSRCHLCKPLLQLPVCVDSKQGSSAPAYLTKAYLLTD